MKTRLSFTVISFFLFILITFAQTKISIEYGEVEKNVYEVSNYGEYFIELDDINLYLFQVSLIDGKGQSYNPKINWDAIAALSGFLNLSSLAIPNKFVVAPAESTQQEKGPNANEIKFIPIEDEYYKKYRDLSIKFNKELNRLKKTFRLSLGQKSQAPNSRELELLKTSLSMLLDVTEAMNDVFVDIQYEERVDSNFNKERLIDITSDFRIIEDKKDKIESAIESLFFCEELFENNKWTSPILKLDTEEQSLQIIIKPTALGKSILQYWEKSEMEIRIRNKNYIKVGISAGAFISTLKSKSFIFQPHSEDENLLEVNTNERLSSGVSANVHLMLMAKPWFGIGLSNGLGIGLTDDIKWQYLLGASIVIGKQNQIYFSAGASFASTNKFNVENGDFISLEQRDRLVSELDNGFSKSGSVGLYGSLSYYISF